MYNKSDEQFIIMKSANEANKQEMKSKNKDPEQKMMKLTEYFKSMLASSITSITNQINNLKCYPT